MASISTTTNSSGLFSTDVTWFDDAEYDVGDYFSYHFEEAVYDIFAGNGDVDYYSNNYLAVYLYGAGGYAELTGSGFLGYSGTVSTMDFSGGGGSFYFTGSMSWNMSGVTRATIKSLDISYGSDRVIMEGSLKIDSNGVSGTLSRYVTITHGLTSEYLGSFSVATGTGTLTKITLSDSSGQSISVSGSFSAQAYFAARDIASTPADLLNTAALFSGDDTFTVPDSAHQWHGFGGRDKMTGGIFADDLYGDDANDTLTGLGGNDWLDGGTGDDTLDGGTGDDSMTGGTGNDKYVVDSSADIIIEQSGEGTDTISSSTSFDMSANAQNVEILILTGTGNIDATGNGGNNTITGNAGNNRIDGGAGADKMAGGAGNDTYVVDDAGDTVTDTAGIDTVEASISWTLGTNLEILLLTGTGDINGTGNTGINTITGNDGSNTLNGGTGADTLIGGLGDDFYVVDNSGDMVSENASGGTDTVFAAATYTLGAEIENLILTGTRAANGTGNAGANTLTGNSGANTLDGGAGADYMSGGGGNDTYIISDLGDVAVETSAAGGTDTVRSAFDYTLDTYFENLVLTGAARVGTGNALANTITGTSGNDTLDGLGGADKLIGGAGDDSYYIDNTRDMASEGTGAGYDAVFSTVDFTLGANIESLALSGAAVKGTGNTLDNLITGNAGNNTLSGMTGNDTLDGGAGADTLIGGTGADTFRFTATDGVSDTVTDFNRSQGDKLDIKDLLAGFDPLSSDITQFVRIDTVGTNSVLFVDADGGGDGFVQMATLSRATGLEDEAALLSAGVLVAS
ncbi:MAG: calcium-binding protein [Alphaproteobacteria bacterium]|nr:calcium-binding protein [Alphaproteobacteria bacterium]